MNQARPVNLNLFTIRFPMPAIVSILHRISGAFLFLLTPFLIWLLGFSLTPDGFEAIQHQFSHFYVHLICWLLLLPFIFHLVAGIRHLLMDIHVGDTKYAGKISSVITVIVAVVLTILVGIWLW